MTYSQPYLTVNLLDRCNKACRYCYRTAIPIERGFQLHQKEALASVEDASSLTTVCMFAGGEPTIWCDEDMDLVTLLVEAARKNGRSAFISNGHVFEDQDYTCRFLGRYMDGSAHPLFLIFSVDFIHGNYDAETESIPFLDNLLTARHVLGAEDVISLRVSSHFTANPRLNIPLRVFERYTAQNVVCEQTDFMTWGRGADIEDLSVYLQIGGRSKASLGPFKAALVQRMVAQGKLTEEHEFEDLDNIEVLRRLSVCGTSPNFLISWDRTYYYCIPHLGHDWFAVSEIGSLNPDKLRAFHSARPVIEEIQKLSIFGFLDKYRALIPDRVLEEVISIREGTRFAGCSVCLQLHKEGLLDEINQKIL